MLKQLSSDLIENGARLEVDGATKPVVCVRVPRIAELRSMRRGLLILVRAHLLSDVSQTAVLDSFVDYVNLQLGSE